MPFLFSGVLSIYRIFVFVIVCFPVNVLQWNCRSLMIRIPDLLYVLEEYEIGIAALCKTRFGDGMSPPFANYEICTCNRNRQGGGVAIMVDRRFRFSLISDTRLDGVASENDIEIIFGKGMARLQQALIHLFCLQSTSWE